MGGPDKDTQHNATPQEWVTCPDIDAIHNVRSFEEPKITHQEENSNRVPYQRLQEPV